MLLLYLTKEVLEAIFADGSETLHVVTLHLGDYQELQGSRSQPVAGSPWGLQFPLVLPA